ncbi:MAG: ATP-dependent Clp protease adaptor ClpS [Bacteroidales bacterium]|nr:ATP-dependent Clp protease adaptor ClpS [Bacteroidales bacterium]
MEKEKQQYSGSTDELLDEEKSLILINDDVNSFDYVIDTLVKVCNHTREQAETCAWITHYKGRCAVKSGSFDELKPYYERLLNHHLTVKIQ